jgi:hypothetical protein
MLFKPENLSGRRLHFFPSALNATTRRANPPFLVLAAF